ncbi:Tyr recombinase domain-containing protein, partial [Dysosmobacter welbionis]
ENNIRPLGQRNGLAALHDGNFSVLNLGGIEFRKRRELRGFPSEVIGKLAAGVLAILRSEGDGHGGDFYFDGQLFPAPGKAGVCGDGGLAHAGGDQFITCDFD